MKLSTAALLFASGVGGYQLADPITPAKMLLILETHQDYNLSHERAVNHVYVMVAEARGGGFAGSSPINRARMQMYIRLWLNAYDRRVIMGEGGPLLPIAEELKKIKDPESQALRFFGWSKGKAR